MQIFNFIQTYFTVKGFKDFTSELCLKLGYGITFFVALFGSLFFGYFTFSLYKVPVKDIQIYATKVMGSEEKDSFNLQINMDYGLDITEKYKRDFKPGIEFWIDESDNWRYNKDLKVSEIKGRSNPVTGVSIKYNAREIIELLDSKSEKIGNIEFMSKASSIYQIDMVESYPPHTFFKTPPIDTFTIYRSYVSAGIGNYTYKGREKESAIYQVSTNRVDSISGLESYCSKSILALSDTGLNRAVLIPSTELLTRPSKMSDFDISQGYFKFTIDLPTNGEYTLLEFDFGGATEFSNIYPEPDHISMSAIAYKTPEKIKYIKYRGLWFHAKFKQMENVQILRMFFVTTLFGFFVALMFSSFFKGIKVASRRYKIKMSKKTKKVT